MRRSFGRGFHGRFLAFEITVEPAHNAELQFRRFIVLAGRENQAELVGLTIKTVNMADFFINAQGAGQPEQRVPVRAANQERTRGRERGNLGEIPAVNVHEEIAVAVTVNDTVQM